MPVILSNSPFVQPNPLPMNPQRWSIFCRVIDNFGDVGVCLRLAEELASKGLAIDFWIDRPEILDWMAPKLNSNITIIFWQDGKIIESPTAFDNESSVNSLENRFSDVIIEAFGCEIPSLHQRKIAQQALNGRQITQWINLEYLSAEAFAENNHGLLSPVLRGAGEGAHKWFFYPGLSKNTGGLILENEIRQRISLPTYFETLPQVLNVGLFCYPYAPLHNLLNTLEENLALSERNAVVKIPHGETQNWIKQEMTSPLRVGSDSRSRLEMRYLKPLSQKEFDEMLWSNDLNFVRGEDSLIRAIWVGKPWVWQIYKQSDDAHLAKLDAFLNALECPTFIKEIHWKWNHSLGDTQFLPNLNDLEKWSQWSAWCLKIRSKLQDQVDLVSQLMAFVEDKRQKR